FLPSAPPPLFPLSLHDALPIYRASTLVWRFRILQRIRSEPQLKRGRARLTFMGQAPLRQALPLRRRPCSLTSPPQQDSRDTGSSDRKSTRLNSSHRTISYAVFC